MAGKKFLLCETCGNIVGIIHDSGVPIQCCGKPMKVLEANTTDAAQEKHVPEVKVDGNKVSVQVGSVEHPMENEHFIQWIYLQTDKGGHRRALSPGEKPVAVFALENETPVAVYEYCNLHGLWVKEL